MGISLSQTACSVFGVRSEENPRYEILFKENNKEVRSYSSYIVAKTTVKGDFKSAQGDGFRILAGYIFGANEKKQKISMTAPVTMKNSADSEKIAMTAPVVQSTTIEGMVMTFMMPSKYNLEDLPHPKDNRITLEVVPPKIFGVIRYSGSGRQSTNNKMADELKSWLMTNANYDIISGPSFAGYDPPWTIPYFRRNEMMFELRSKKP